MNRFEPLDQVSSIDANTLNHTANLHKIFESHGSIMQRLMNFEF